MSILDTIDAALVGCCPCGQVLGPDSLSLDWCSPECQQRWFERQAHDPGDVYRRTDAHVGIGMELLGQAPSPFLAAHTRAVEAILWREMMAVRCIDPRGLIRITGV